MILIVGAGILGLCCALEATRRQCSVVVVENPDARPASDAAAAQLGMKGQRFAKDPAFGAKLLGQRHYESWLSSWWPADEESCLRRGVGVDRVLTESDYAEQFRRVSKHEHDLAGALAGPPLFRDGPNRREIHYLQEAAVDAPRLNTTLKQILGRRGVSFVQADASYLDGSFGELLARTAPESLILAAGVGTLGILKAWACPPSLFDSLGRPRLSLGATVVLPAPHGLVQGGAGRPLDLEHFVMETLLHRETKSRVTVTRAGDELRLTSLSVKLEGDGRALGERGLSMSSLASETPNTFADSMRNLEGLLQKHGFSLGCEPSFRVGFRLGFGSQDLVLRRERTLEELLRERPALARLQKPPRVIVFSGANRSGYLYGPALAPRVLELHAEDREL